MPTFDLFNSFIDSLMSNFGFLKKHFEFDYLDEFGFGHCPKGFIDKIPENNSSMKEEIFSFDRNGSLLCEVGERETVFEAITWVADVWYFVVIETTYDEDEADLPTTKLRVYFYGSFEEDDCEAYEK